MSFSTRLEAIRKAHKVSQATLGAALGITQQMISNYEKGTSSPNVEILTKLADYFQISIDYLADHRVSSKNYQQQNHQLLQLFKHISEDDRNRCLMILSSFALISPEEINN